MPSILLRQILVKPDYNSHIRKAKVHLPSPLTEGSYYEVETVRGHIFCMVQQVGPPKGYGVSFFLWSRFLLLVQALTGMNPPQAGVTSASTESFLQLECSSL